MRIVLFTVDDVMFIPTLLDPVLGAEEHEIVRVYVSASMLSWKKFRRKASFFKLPMHKAGLSALRVLRLRDQEAGASLHEAVEAIDEGALIEEVRIPVRTRSMYQLMDETVLAAGPMVVRGLASIEADTAVPIDTSGRPEGYYLYPVWDDFQVFYRRGCRFI